jgi:hypothetical protein
MDMDLETWTWLWKLGHGGLDMVETCGHGGLDMVKLGHGSGNIIAIIFLLHLMLEILNVTASLLELLGDLDMGLCPMLGHGLETVPIGQIVHIHVHVHLSICPFVHLSIVHVHLSMPTFSMCRFNYLSMF